MSSNNVNTVTFKYFNIMLLYTQISQQVSLNQPKSSIWTLHLLFFSFLYLSAPFAEGVVLLVLKSCGVWKGCRTAVSSLATKRVPFSAYTHSLAEQLLGSCHPVNKISAWSCIPNIHPASSLLGHWSRSARSAAEYLYNSAAQCERL